MMNLRKQELLAQEEHAQMEHLKQANLEKKYRYGDYVRETFQPKVSESKRLELEKRVTTLSHPVKT